MIIDLHLATRHHPYTNTTPRLLCLNPFLSNDCRPTPTQAHSYPRSTAQPVSPLRPIATKTTTTDLANGTSPRQLNAILDCRLDFPPVLPPPNTIFLPRDTLRPKPTYQTLAPYQTLRTDHLPPLSAESIPTVPSNAPPYNFTAITSTAPIDSLAPTPNYPIHPPLASFPSLTTEPSTPESPTSESSTSESWTLGSPPPESGVFADHERYIHRPPHQILTSEGEPTPYFVPWYRAQFYYCRRTV